jgi:hypothetical protein
VEGTTKNAVSARSAASGVWPRTVRTAPL